MALDLAESILFQAGVSLAKLRPAETTRDIAARLDAKALEREIAIVMYVSIAKCTKCGQDYVGPSNPMVKLRRELDGANRYVPCSGDEPLYQHLPREIKEIPVELKTCPGCFLR
jgi:hypothetical protein